MRQHDAKLIFHDTEVSSFVHDIWWIPATSMLSIHHPFSGTHAWQMPIPFSKWAGGFLPTQACILPTQQQLKLPRGAHCLALSVVVGEGRRLPGKTATDKKQVSGWANTPLQAGQQHPYAVTSFFTSTRGWKLASSGMRSRGFGWEKWARKSMMVKPNYANHLRQKVTYVAWSACVCYPPFS